MDRIQACSIALVFMLAGCSSGPTRLIIGSKNFTEQLVIGEIVAAHLEKKLGQPVVRRLNLGGTLLAHQALVTGSIDMYPEYTGTALTAVLKLPASNNPSQVFERISHDYSSRWNLHWMPSLGFNNTFAMVVRGETARSGNLTTITDAAKRANPWKLGVGYEFLQRSDGYKGLVSTYGMRVDGQPVSMDLGLLYRALESKQVEMAAANATDGQIGIMDVVVLRDDRHYFPPYECAMVVREATLKAHPGLKEALAELSGKLTEKEMRRMNHEVEGKHRSPAEVAAEFLQKR